MKDARPLLVLLRSGATAGALRTLLDRFDSAEAALAADPADWTQAGLGAAPAAALLNPDHAVIEADLEWLDGPARHLIGWHSPDYPMLLRSAVHPPAMLFVAGDPDLLWHPQVAVVGSRRPSAGGRDNARHFARVFGQRGMAVTSGLAEGIDTAAHQGAMETSRTVAVLGTGPDLCYPPGNRPLIEAIAESGAVVSEHPPGTGGKRQHFPSRNRLIAGLSLGTVVIEAAVRSGALITARMATDAGREVFALPGSIHNPMARGCHRLIRQGVALAESPEEVMEALSVLAASLSEALRGRLADGPAAAPVGKARRVGNAGADQPGNGSADRVGVGSTEEQAVLRSIGHDPVNIDQLCQRTGLTVGPLSAMLLTMELDGKISAEHGRYSRTS